MTKKSQSKPNTQIIPYHMEITIKSPYDLVMISWDLEGAHGSTACEAWMCQSEIDKLERTGYTVKTVKLI